MQLVLHLFVVKMYLDADLANPVTTATNYNYSPDKEYLDVFFKSTIHTQHTKPLYLYLPLSM